MNILQRRWPVTIGVMGLLIGGFAISVTGAVMGDIIPGGIGGLMIIVGIISSGYADSLERDEQGM